MKSSSKPLQFGTLAVLAAFICSACGNESDGGRAGESATANPMVRQLCPTGGPHETQGNRRLALIVGVGKYKNARINALQGPPNDAQNFYDLLTGPGGYDFPRDNVCMLLDEQATTAAVKAVFEGFLVGRTREGKDDLAVFYFAGHGSQIKDRDDDEVDQCDETFMLHDARTDTPNGRVKDLVDDEFHRMLAGLYARTHNIVVILDSCNSGTATRGTSAHTARYEKPDDPTDKCELRPGAARKLESGWSPRDAFPGLIAMTAASDGTSAIEDAGAGVFTDALIDVLLQGADEPLTYAQIARQVPARVSVESRQTPYFHGDLERAVFDTSGTRRPLGWNVDAVGEDFVEISGVPLAGLGPGAEFRIYDGGLTGRAASDPANSKATVAVTEAEGLWAKARLPDGVTTVEKDDLAVMIRPADKVLTIKVRIRPENEPGGIPADRAEELRTRIARNEEAAMFIDLVDRNDNFELSLEHEQLVLRGPENAIRNTYNSDIWVPDSLWHHARQKALRLLHGEGGKDFVDQETLRVEIVPAQEQPPGVEGEWNKAAPNKEQIVPLGFHVNVRVSLSESAPRMKPLLVGGVFMSSDGNTYGFPCDGRLVPLRPGDSVVFGATAEPGSACRQSETFAAGPPLDTQDHVLVFGTQQENPVPWYLLTQTAKVRGESSLKRGPLYGALHRYMQPGTRGFKRVSVEEVDTTTWTMSSMTMRVLEQRSTAE